MDLAASKQSSPDRLARTTPESKYSNSRRRLGESVRRLMYVNQHVHQCRSGWRLVPRSPTNPAMKASSAPPARSAVISTRGCTSQATRLAAALDKGCGGARSAVASRTQDTSLQGRPWLRSCATTMPQGVRTTQLLKICAAGSRPSLMRWTQMRNERLAQCGAFPAAVVTPHESFIDEAFGLPGRPACGVWRPELYKVGTAAACY
mmetsp:Transcript_11347/g.28579  ORF Transcript_11347/g.28579 Transcript_11347/m.28579 type:complete len:205 (-) Transcript_11347:24-638(-)